MLMLERLKTKSVDGELALGGSASGQDGMGWVGMWIQVSRSTWDINGTWRGCVASSRLETLKPHAG